MKQRNKKRASCDNEARETESERFELSRHLRDLPHFECGPFSQTWVRLPVDELWKTR